MTAEHQIHAVVGKHAQQVPRIVDDVALATSARYRHEVMVHGHDLELGWIQRKALLEPEVKVAADSAGVEVGLAGVQSDDPHALQLQLAAPGAEQLLKVDVAHIASVVVPDQHHLTLAFDALQQAVGLLELGAKSHVGQVAGHHHDVGSKFVELVDNAIRQARNVKRRAAVQVRDLRNDDWLTHGDRPP